MLAGFHSSATSMALYKSDVFLSQGMSMFSKCFRFNVGNEIVPISLSNIY